MGVHLRIVHAALPAARRHHAPRRPHRPHSKTGPLTRFASQNGGGTFPAVGVGAKRAVPRRARYCFVAAWAVGAPQERGSGGAGGGWAILDAVGDLQHRGL